MRAAVARARRAVLQRPESASTVPLSSAPAKRVHVRLEERMAGRPRVTILALVGAVLALVAGPVAVASAAPAPQAKWTVMVYMSGDNNLEDYIVKDLELELAASGSNANVQITALADRGPGHDTSRGDWQTTKPLHPTPGMVAATAEA